MYKSEQLALSLKHLIESATWQPHQKLPSLRQQVEQSGFRLMTVLNAYQELEAQGLIYSREKSGYFVADHRADLQKNSVIRNDKIAINSVVFQYLKSVQAEGILPLGSAFPDSQLLYSAKLMQNVGAAAPGKDALEAKR